MTINKYYVLVPKACGIKENQPRPSSKESLRQQAVKQAQNEGGLPH